MAAQKGVVATVAGEDEVETLEVRLCHAPGAQARQVVAAALGMGDRARIRRLADVVAMGAGRIDRDAVGEPRALDERAKHALRGGRAADVARADEQDASGNHDSLGLT